MLNKNKNNQLGKTMLETLLYLVIAGVLASGVLYLIGKVFRRIISTKNMTDFVTLVQNVHARHSAIGSYAGISAKKMIDDKVVPHSMTAGDKIVNKYKEEVVLETSADAEYQYLFYITVPNINTNDCLEYLKLKWHEESGATLVSITAQNQTTTDKQTYGFSYDPDYDPSTYKQLPVPMADIVNLCGGKTTITWEFN